MVSLVWLIPALPLLGFLLLLAVGPRLGEPLAPTSEIERTDAAQPISMQTAPVLRVLLMASYTQATQALQDNVRRQVAHVPSNAEVKLVNAQVC